MILELDVGNSRIKWRLFDELSGSAVQHGHVNTVEELAAALSQTQKPQLIRMCSVRQAAFTAAISDWAKQKWNLTVQLVQVSQTCGGVTNQYKDPARLGIDRWLAMLAACKQAGGACIIVDSGTALTIDVVDSQGLHQGGYILPGLVLMGRSLEANTGIRLAADADLPILDLGHSTDHAVRNGSLAALVVLIRHVIEATREHAPAAPVYYTGGDADLLAASVAIGNHQIVPGLVLDGLAIACPYP